MSPPKAFSPDEMRYLIEIEFRKLKVDIDECIATQKVIELSRPDDPNVQHLTDLWHRIAEKLAGLETSMRAEGYLK